jgi:Cu(I)/Ag(I) efflux system protein CusF
MTRLMMLGGTAYLLLLSGAAPVEAAVTATRPQGIPVSVQLAHEGHTGAVQASGTVNAVDPARHTVNLSHGSIRALGWPAMTMDFPVGADVDLDALKPGMRVNFTLVHGSGGGMVVDAIRPATGSNH